MAKRAVTKGDYDGLISVARSYSVNLEEIRDTIKLLIRNHMRARGDETLEELYYLELSYILNSGYFVDDLTRC
jgi:hypothetical protein